MLVGPDAKQKHSFWLLGCGSPPNASLEHSIWSVTRTAHAQLSFVPYFTNPLHVHAVPLCSLEHFPHARPVWLGSAQTSTSTSGTVATVSFTGAAVAQVTCMPWNFAGIWNLPTHGFVTVPPMHATDLQ